MILERQDFEMFSGNTKSITVVVVEEAGEPVNLTGALAIDWHLKRAPGARLSLVKKSLDDGIMITDAISGEFEISLDVQDTLSLGGTYYHECSIISAVGNRATVLYGYVTIR